MKPYQKYVVYKNIIEQIVTAFVRFLIFIPVLSGNQIWVDNLDNFLEEHLDDTKGGS